MNRTAHGPRARCVSRSQQIRRGHRRTDLRSVHRQELGSRFRRLVDGDDAQLYSFGKRRGCQLEAHLRVLSWLLRVVRDEEDSPAGLSEGVWQSGAWRVGERPTQQVLKGGHGEGAPSAPQRVRRRQCRSPSRASFLHSAADVASHNLVLEGLVALDKRDRPRLGMHRCQGPQQERATALATHSTTPRARASGTMGQKTRDVFRKHWRARGENASESKYWRARRAAAKNKEVMSRLTCAQRMNSRSTTHGAHPA